MLIAAHKKLLRAYKSLLRLNLKALKSSLKGSFELIKALEHSKSSKELKEALKNSKR